MDDNIVRTIDPNEFFLNGLFKECLDGIRDDLIEAQNNSDLYYEKIQLDAQMGPELWANHYNQALTIKGSARDRQLKFLNMFKERVTKKESIKVLEDAKNKNPSGASFNHTEFNNMMEQLEKKGINPIDIDD